MNSSSIFEEVEIIPTQNFHLAKNITLHEPHIPGYNHSPQMFVFIGLIFVLLLTIGNFFLFLMIIYEKYGMDSPKRTVTNQLLSSICGNLIVFNSVFLTIHTVNILGLESKTSKTIISIKRVMEFHSKIGQIQ